MGKAMIVFTLILILCLVLIFIFYRKQNSKGKLNNHQMMLILAISSVMMALGAILKVFGIMLTPNMRISFFAIPLILTGLCCGMEYGILTALGADLLYSLFSGYAFNPAFTISALYWGILGGIFRYFKRCNHLSLWVILIGVLICSLCETHTNILITYLLYGTYTTMAVLVTKYIVLIIKLPIITFLVYLLTKRVIDKIQLVRSL